MTCRSRAASALRLPTMLVLAGWLGCADAAAALPPPVVRAFLEEQIPLSAVGAYVQEVGAPRPIFSWQATRAMNPASTMKLVTTFAALELLGPDYRWRTEAYADGPIADGTLEGNLVLKGYGDPKITIEQFQAFVASLRATGLKSISGDLVLDRSYFAPARHDPAAFDAQPLKPYNVGPDALLVNFKSVRFVFTPNPTGDEVAVHAEPPLGNVGMHGAPRAAPGECVDWRASLTATFLNRGNRADATFGGAYPIACGERDWYVALLDQADYTLAMFQHYWADAGGSFAGKVRNARTPPGAKLLATLQSPPLYDAVRDINKLSNNVMARQLFLTLATTTYPPPATLTHAAAAVRRWLVARKLSFPELVLDNGSGLSRRERISAQSMARLLLAADASKVHSDYVSSLAVSATDGTVRKRFVDENLADRAFLKTGSLEGVRAIAGFVLAPSGRRFVVVCFVNHANAARAQHALDLLVESAYGAASGESGR